MANPNFDEVGFATALLTGPRPAMGSHAHPQFTSEDVNFGIQA